jgi:hypothetical protein
MARRGRRQTQALGTVLVVVLLFLLTVAFIYTIWQSARAAHRADCFRRAQAQALCCGPRFGGTAKPAKRSNFLRRLALRIFAWPRPRRPAAPTLATSATALAAKTG